MKANQRIDFLDYLKAICIILVVITHYDWSDKHTFIFTMFINMAVPVFMIISGYNFAMSYKKKAKGCLAGMYSPKMILSKFKRFSIPFVWICLAEIVLLVIEDKHINLPRIFLFGAYGPGSYYFPVMIQLLVIFPLIYLLIEKNAVTGLVITGACNVLFEAGIVFLGVDEYYYRLMIGRYLLLIAMGCFLYLHPEKRVKKFQLALMLAAGLFYIIVILGKYLHIDIFHYWAPTAMPIAFYIFPIIVLMFRSFYHTHIKGFAGTMLTKIGKASYHIFLVQMVYYHFGLGGPVMKMDWLIAVPYNLLITITAGLAFYYVDNYFCKNIFVMPKKLRLRSDS